MLKNKNIICISSIDWDFVWQGHQEIMANFAKSGNRVLFIENTGVRTPNFRDIKRLKKRINNWFRSIKGFRQEAENLYVYSPMILPFPYSRFMRWINRALLIKPLKRWIKTMGFRSPIIWTFLPTGTALDIIDNIDKELLVYYCIADFYELVNNPRKISRTENDLIRKSDIIFVQGEVLAKKCRRFNDNVHIFPFGVNMEVFDDFQRVPEKVPGDIKEIKRPIIGYIGGIHRHIDFNLLRFIALSHPEWSIVFIGPCQTDTPKINNLGNVFLLGQKDFTLLPSYISEFDVGIIPYETNEYTTTVFPTKLNEYHAMGKPVVSTALPEIIRFNLENNDLVLVGNTYQEFVDCISTALTNSKEGMVKQRMGLAERNNWAGRIEEMSDLLEYTIERKASKPVEWQDVFLRLYRTARRKALTISAIFICAYLLLFYTPLVWIVAAPLNISEAPQKADCIVVLAGGVGESGKAGQGYEERVEYAVKLYKEDLARHVIFSSGYVYAFKEALVMKALAVSLGIPAEAVILEDKAINTYQNMKFTKEIIENKNWKHVLLVSTPYHMRRISLVARKIAPELKVVYTPIPRSLFYSHSSKDAKGRRVWRRANLQQIKAICHEYLGILYYWFKGYI
ncbi:MAG: ElyC/SanA/YdcF family protein [Candidatus Omnitrophota bacterium]